MFMYLYRIKRLPFIFFLSISFIIAITLIIVAQPLNDKEEKQLKVFQLSSVLEKQHSFPQSNAYFKNALSYFRHEHYIFAIQELEKIEYSNLYLPLYLKSQLLEGKCYEELSRWESALHIYQEVMDEVPIMQDYILYLLGKVYLSINDSRSAIESFQRLIEEYPNSVSVSLARYQSALIYLENNQLEQFLKECRSAMEFSLEEQFKAKVLIKMSDVLWEKGLFIDSLIYLKELLENRYDREHISRDENLYVKRFQIVKQNEKVEIMPELSLFCAEIVFNYRQYQMAETLYEEVILLNSDKIDLTQVYYDRARAIHYQGEYERAIEQCLYIIRTFSNPDIITKTSYLHAGALLSSGNRSQAIEKYQEVINKYPESYFAQSSYLRLAEIDFLQDEEEEGMNMLNLLISEYPQSDQAREACWKLARHYNNKNVLHKAMEYYQLIYDRFPKSGQGDDALYWLGKLPFSQNKEEGMKWYKMLLDQFPDSYYAFRIPAEIKESNNNLENMISLSKENSLGEFKKGNFPKDQAAQLSIYRAELLYDIGFYQGSILEIMHALSLEPGNVYATYLLTETYYQSDEYYLSISWAQVLLNHFLVNDAISQIPFRIWELTFPTNYSTIVKDLVDHYGLDPYLIWSTIREESHFNPYCESRAGARGLMQIILSTGDWIAQKVDYREFDYDLLFVPDINIRFGCWYLHYLQEKFDKNIYLIIAGYNAGPGITDRWIQDIDMSDIDYFIENIPYQETTEHIKKVMRSYAIYKIIYNNQS